MGLVKNEFDPNTLRWLDGTPVNFVQWQDGEPNSDETCVRLLQMKYADLECTNSKLFICEMGMYILV